MMRVYSKGADMNKSDRRVKGLGEVSIQVRDLDAMQKFYEEVVGLEVLKRDESLYSSKSRKDMAIIHRISPSFRRRTVTSSRPNQSN